MVFSGIFTNTIVNVSGLNTIEITINPDDTIQAAYLNNTIIRGDYSTDTDAQGIVELRRILSSGVYLPLVRS